MTKKDLVELAAQLAIVRREIVYSPLTGNASPREAGLMNYVALNGSALAVEARQRVWTECVRAVILACRATSSKFDEQRFRDACNK